MSPVTACARLMHWPISLSPNHVVLRPSSRRRGPCHASATPATPDIWRAIRRIRRRNLFPLSPLTSGINKPPYPGLLWPRGPLHRPGSRIASIHVAANHGTMLAAGLCHWYLDPGGLVGEAALPIHYPRPTP